MHYKNEESFSRAHKESGIHGAYLLFGAEEYLIDAWRKRLMKPFEGAGDFNLQRLDGRGLNCDALYDAVEAMPLMGMPGGNGKCVVVDDLNLSKLSPGDQNKLFDIAADLPSDCVLIITGKSAFDTKSAAGKKLVKLVGETGTAAELGSRGKTGLVTFLKGLAKREGCELPTPLAHQIIERCGDDMNTLRGEMAKLCAYAGYGTITAEHVDGVTIPRVEARVFDLSKAILSGRTESAMGILADLFELREPPIGILSVLIMAYVDMYRARIARDSGITVAAFTQLFHYKSEYRAKNAYNCRLSADALERALEALYNCDRRMKSTGIDDKVLLEQAVTKLFMVGG